MEKKMIQESKTMSACSLRTRTQSALVPTVLLSLVCAVQSFGQVIAVDAGTALGVPNQPNRIETILNSIAIVNDRFDLSRDLPAVSTDASDNADREVWQRLTAGIQAGHPMLRFDSECVQRERAAVDGLLRGHLNAFLSPFRTQMSSALLLYKRRASSHAFPEAVRVRQLLLQLERQRSDSTLQISPQTQDEFNRIEREFFAGFDALSEARRRWSRMGIRVTFIPSFGVTQNGHIMIRATLEINGRTNFMRLLSNGQQASFRSLLTGMIDMNTDAIEFDDIAVSFQMPYDVYNGIRSDIFAENLRRLYLAERCRSSR